MMVEHQAYWSVQLAIILSWSWSWSWSWYWKEKLIEIDTMIDEREQDSC